MNNKYFLLLLLGFCLAFSSLVEAEEDKGFTQLDNRWALIIDIPRVEQTKSLDYAQSLESFRNSLIQSGFAADHVLVFSSTSSEAAWQPTSDNIKTLIAGIKKPDDVAWIKAGSSAPARIRQNDGAAELLVFVMAEGFATKDQTKAIIVPQDVNPDSLSKSLDNPKVISVGDLESALLDSHIERTMLLVNFQTTEGVRSAAKKNRDLASPNLKALARSSAKQRAQQEEENSYLHVQISTKNQSLTEKAAFSFYRMIQDGLQGAADIAGNQDGIVQATELADYIKSNTQGFASVETAQNGNGTFALAKSIKTVNIPKGLFQEIGSTPSLKNTSTGIDALRRENENSGR